jgi:uncharacterized membrane protein/Mg-chelatase subunit ChlD
MGSHTLAFGSPYHLLLLIPILPLIWWLSCHSLSGMHVWRRWLAVLLRALVVTLVVAALAEVQLVQRSDRLSVIFLIDHSLSISHDQTDLMTKYVNRAIDQRFKRKDRTDFAGVIIFGRDAAMELPPWDDRQQIERIESMVDRESTNLADALKLAQASFRHDAAKRVVILTDGNENLGDANQQAQVLIDAGVSIDVVPIHSSARAEIAVEKISIPTDIRKGQPFNVNVVLSNSAPPGSPPVPGKLTILRRGSDREISLLEPPNDAVELPPGKKVFTIPKQVINEPDFYTYEAHFVPDHAEDDGMLQNNRATTFTHIRGKGQVLLIEDHENKGEFDYLVSRLKAQNIEVAIRDTRGENLFSDLSQLQPYDAVVLANVPREAFSDEQIEILVRNTQSMGAGLLMLGGERSFGAGGWTNTALEEAMPVDFQIKAAKVVPIGALAMIMHASEMPQGNYWQKLIAQEALKTLGSLDYCGILHYGMKGDEWLWNGGLKQVGPNRRMMTSLLMNMTPGDMPSFDGQLLLALTAFQNLGEKAGAKHMIVISDGDPSLTNLGTLTQLKSIGVKVSTVAIGTHGAAGGLTDFLRQIADRTGGKYYVVNNPNMLPRIYQAEARRVARPLVFEAKEGFSPEIKLDHEMVRGLEQVLPPITGYVLTTVKQNPLVEVPVISPRPTTSSDGRNNSILAGWTYGQGRSAVITTDAGVRWATSWKGWAGYDKLFQQTVAWVMRSANDDAHFTVASEVVDGKVRTVITGLDQNDEFLNFLSMSGSVVGPDLKPIDMPVKQVAPGRYIGECPATQKGSYFINVIPGPGRAPIRTGINVPYSDEFRPRDTNGTLLKNIASLKPKGGKPGHVIDVPGKADTLDVAAEQMLSTDVFRHDMPKAESNQDIWHWSVFAASVLFWGDVFFRRVAIRFGWLVEAWKRTWAWLLRQELAAPVPATMSRLRSRKQEVAEHIEQRRAGARFEPTPESSVDLSVLSESADKAPPPATPVKPITTEPQPEPGEYTSRLLKAKKKVWEERDEPPKDAK